MGVEAFVWNYEDGEPLTLSFADVRSAFGDLVASWEPEYGCLRLEFTDPPDSCDVFCGADAAETGRVRSVMISRPVRHPELWRSVLRIMSENHALLFFSDDTTPLVWNIEAIAHFPGNLIADLGKPVCVRTPDDIIASHER